MKVFLSASVPLPDRDRLFIETADVVAIREAVKGLIFVLLERSGHLVYGGHPAITPLVRLLYSQTGTSVGEFVTLYLSRFFEDRFPPDIEEFANVRKIDAVENDREKSLLAMRRAMLSEGLYDCAIFIGGMEGVISECDLFAEMHPGLPMFPIASTGAAARVLYDRLHPRMPILESELTYVTLFRALLPRV